MPNHELVYPGANQITHYIGEISRIYQAGNATEHSYRLALQTLLISIVQAQNLSQLKNLRFTNEPKHIACGAPDYIVARNGIPVGYIEAKDIGIDLNGKAQKAQFDRYKQALNNIIFTDYIDFHLYINGVFADSVKIAEVKGDKISPISANFGKFERVIQTFGTTRPQGVTSPTELAKMMAGKAHLMAEIIENVINNAIETKGKDNVLLEQMDAFKEVLIKTISPKEFADVYAQTVAYGLFAARLHDKSPDTFDRTKAANLIPKINPFLRQLFNIIAGINIHTQICWVVDDLADTFRTANMAAFNAVAPRSLRCIEPVEIRSLSEVEMSVAEMQNDPMIYFYEEFLAAYDPALRKNRGVWYTPQPIVNFIVRAVDDILRKEFKLADGLADKSKTMASVVIKTDENGEDVPDVRDVEMHKVQILDPATGSGTFLAEVVNQIHEKFRGQGGAWQGYVKDHLIPRLNGFELLMASYTMAHIKLEHLLTQTGYEPQDDQRLRVYLTNSLEEFHIGTGTPFGQFLAREANEANNIKRDVPVMVVLGNPPYSGESQNRGEWMARLMDDYKKEPPSDSTLQEKNPDSWLEVHEQSAEKLYERNSKWINDDYCKFIRLGQYFVDKNKEGVLAYINNHGFIDNPTFRGMRWSLMKSFDKIYILDLHGNSRKQEVCPDGSTDENVFDIQQGVSINIFVKTGKKKRGKLAEVHHLDLYGKREEKYKYLLKSKFSKVPFTKLRPSAPEYFFAPKDYGVKEEYEKGFSVRELFPVNGVGITTAHDDFVIDNDKNVLVARFKKFKMLSPIPKELHTTFNVNKKKGWDILDGWRNLQDARDVSEYVKPISYRPFDNRCVFYEKKLIWRPVEKIMKHFLYGKNVGLVFRRQQPESMDLYIFCSNAIVADGYIRSDNKGGESVAPVYLYSSPQSRKPNLNEAIIKKISDSMNLKFESEKKGGKKSFAPIDLFDYIYAVLHSPQYRERYKEFLKMDFPRVPYPKSAEQFRALVKIGEKLRRLHLLEDVEPKKGVADYPVNGSDVVEKINYETSSGIVYNAPINSGKVSGKVYINANQYFDNVPLNAFEFYVGGYQPAQKWLKDRKGRKLEYDDIEHYRKIILILRETAALMEAIPDFV